MGPDEENSTDKRNQDVIRIGFQDSLNTMDNTCRSPQFADKNPVRTRTEKKIQTVIVNVN